MTDQSSGGTERSVPRNEVIQGDALEVIKTLPDNSVDCIITSPPYWGKRDYQIDGQIGVEEKANEFVEELTEILVECERVLDGSLWLNIGDTYNGCSIIRPDSMASHYDAGDDGYEDQLAENRENSGVRRRSSSQYGFSRQSRLFIPLRVADGLCNSGYICRGQVIWHKDNPKPEGRVSTRLTQSWEPIFRFATGEGVKFYRDRVAEPNDVWSIPTERDSDHPAPFPIELPERAIKLSTDERDVVFDPFCGGGTALQAAKKLNRQYIGCDINPEFVRMAQKNIEEVQQSLRYVQPATEQQEGDR